jgi:hypothetical protein
MKGQMFLLITAVIITSLLILRFSVGTPSIEKELESLRSKFEEKIFDNIVEELKKSEEFSYYEQDKIVSNVFNFANFTRRKMNERGLDFEFLYVGTLANNSNNQMNITIINFLNKAIDATLILNSTPQQTDSKNNIGDGSTWNTNFSFTPGTEYLLTLNYTYSTLTTNVTEEIIIKTKSDKNVYVGFFDIELKSSEATHKNKFQTNFTLS